MAEVLTLEVSDAVIDVLRSKAMQRGQSKEDIATLMLAERIEYEAADMDPATLSAIRRGIADGEAGREQPFEEYVAEMESKRRARRTEDRL